MSENWTPYVTAQALLEILPSFGRLITSRMRDGDDDVATLMQMSVLRRLKDHPVTISDLAKLRKVSLQSASVLVQALVERGWLVRTPDPDDRRRSFVEVTPEGVRRAEETHQQMTEMIAEILEGLTDEELAAASIFLPGLRRLGAERMSHQPQSEE